MRPDRSNRLFAAVTTFALIGLAVPAAEAGITIYESAPATVGSDQGLRLHLVDKRTSGRSTCLVEVTISDQSGPVHIDSRNLAPGQISTVTFNPPAQRGGTRTLVAKVVAEVADPQPCDEVQTGASLEIYDTKSGKTAYSGSASELIGPQNVLVTPLGFCGNAACNIVNASSTKSVTVFAELVLGTGLSVVQSNFVTVQPRTGRTLVEGQIFNTGGIGQGIHCGGFCRFRLIDGNKEDVRASMRLLDGGDLGDGDESYHYIDAY